MIKIPKFDEPTLPKDSALINFKNSTLFLISLVTELLGIIVTVFNFQELSLELKIIVILALACFIMFVDIIVLYIKNREHYFKHIYVINMYENLCNQIVALQKKSTNMEQRINDISKKNS